MKYQEAGSIGYTDGSKTASSTGAGIYSANKNNHYALGICADVIHAEVFAFSNAQMIKVQLFWIPDSILHQRLGSRQTLAALGNYS